MKQNLVGNVFSVVCLSALLVACGKQEQAVSARPAVQVARADFDMAANELADTRLLAPFDGYDSRPTSSAIRRCARSRRW
ncbi:hypothetical protein [uncultured Mediterranea sp.]|uniref:hypothetical protein n=1 Tax=uncultured Mediterranea sp. TaxID=1926662 RepID=UPI0027D9607D|nr:hypothetical protein [uncultured Mediterranea sp.]